LKTLNYVVIGLFVGSIAYVVSNYHKLSTESIGHSPIFFPILLLWTLCMAYFFGFFGIAFLDTDAISQSPSSFGLAELKKKADDTTNYARTRERVASFEQNRQRVTSFDQQRKTPVNIAGNNERIVPSGATSCTQQVTGGKSDVNIDDIKFDELSDDLVLQHLKDGSLKDHQLEKKLGNYERAVNLRRQLYENVLNKKLDLIPYEGYDYNKVFGANCEIVIGYVPIPCGIVGPLIINGEPIYVPMATTEGCLVASTNRGCKAISSSGGCQAVLLKDAITRAPCLRMPSAMRAAAMKHWLNVPENFAKIEAAFNSTTNYGKLESIESTIAARNIYLRFCCMSGDAMGMNMVSKGCLKAIEVLQIDFPDLILVAISGNMCTDKKPSAINWILGRGKSVVVEATIPEKIVKSVLKSSVHDMIETNKQKNHIGSAMAGSIGGFNAHAANIVTAVYLATGQDPAQNVESSNCLTIMEFADDGQSLYVSCTMPSIEVGTVGGGTSLPAQAGCLEICGVRGAAKGSDSLPGDNSRKLAQIVAASVLAGELSLMAALAANHLVRSHMQHNRKPTENPPTAVEVNASLIRRCDSMPELGKKV
jgi:hydroxymethylglutaryl-CoA reductase (NADPH)